MIRMMQRVKWAMRESQHEGLRQGHWSSWFCSIYRPSDTNWNISATDFELVSLHNHVHQFLTVNLSIYIKRIFICDIHRYVHILFIWYIYTHVYVYICLYTYIYTHYWICTICISMYIHTQTSAYILSLYMCIHTYANTQLVLFPWRTMTKQGVNFPRDQKLSESLADICRYLSRRDLGQTCRI